VIQTASPVGTTDKRLQSSLQDFIENACSIPATEVAGYFHIIPAEPA